MKVFLCNLPEFARNSFRAHCPGFPGASLKRKRIDIDMEDLGRVIKLRREKLDELRGDGDLSIHQPVSYKHHSCLPWWKSIQKSLKKSWMEVNAEYITAGRMMSRRKHGKTTFVNIKDASGDIQVFINKTALGETAYEIFGKFDVGDIIGVEGRISKTKTGELTLFASKVTLLSKSLLPLPEKWHGLKDVELRYRQRYVDLIVNPEVKESFRCQK